MSGVDLDPTRLAGAIAFATAAIACAAAGAIAPRRATLWRTLGVVQIVLVAEVLLGLRYRLHGVFNDLLQARGWYASRADWQGELLLVVLAAAMALIAFACWRHRDDGPASVAIAATALGVSLFATETVSLHRIDAIMYAPAGPVLALAWMWMGVGVLVGAAALTAMASRR